MADKIPVIVDNRGENKVRHVLQKLLPALYRIGVATNQFRVLSPNGAARLPVLLREATMVFLRRQ